MTRSIAVDFIRDKIRCNRVCPARVHTPFVDGIENTYPGREPRCSSSFPSISPSAGWTPEEVAALALLSVLG